MVVRSATWAEGLALTDGFDACLSGRHGDVRSGWYPVTHELIVRVVCID